MRFLEPEWEMAGGSPGRAGEYESTGLDRWPLVQNSKAEALNAQRLTAIKKIFLIISNQLLLNHEQTVVCEAYAILYSVGGPHELCDKRRKG